MKIDISKIPNKILFGGVLLLLIFILLLSIKSCNAEKHYSEALIDIANYKDTVKTYKSKSGKIIEYNNALQVNVNELKAIKDSLINYTENIDIPEPEVIIQTKTKTVIDSIPIISFIKTNGKLDTNFTINESYYSIVGNINSERLALDSINIPNKSTIVVGEKKTKWWKKNKYIITVDNNNPYINNMGIKSYTLTEEVKNISIGPSIGYGLYLDPVKSNIGHGITIGFTATYNLINF